MALRERNRKFVVLANWKMYKTISEGMDYIRTLKENNWIHENAVEIILCIPFTILSAAVREALKGKIEIGAQNVYDHDWGPFTGEISAPMLSEIGCRYCMIGHSWRRQQTHENDFYVNRKVKLLNKYGIIPIICIGESIEEREKGQTLEKLKEQIEICFDGLSHEQMMRAIVLYEPIWAIGTGKVATLEQAEQAHHFIRKKIEQCFSEKVAERTRIVYGGSVKWHNVSEMLDSKNIDGVGVGSDSLDVNNFVKTAAACIKFIKSI